MWRKARAIGSSAARRALPFHVEKPTAIERFTMKLMPLRSFCMKSARSTAISTQAPQPRESCRLSKWLRLRRIDARLRAMASHTLCQPVQPRDSSRLAK